MPEIMKGLKDVYFDNTEASFIDGDVGKLLYRGYSIHDLAEKSTFEEVVYLLLYGELPSQSELTDFDAKLRANRRIPDQVIEVLNLVQNSHPMDALRTGISALSAFDEDVTDNSPEATIRKGIRLTAMGPTLVAAHHRLRQGLEPVAPNPDLNHAGNFLYMLFDEMPDEETVKLLDVDFILHAEHGANASAFGARVAASTLSDLHSAVTTGVGVLKGPWHGGAAEEVMRMALDIGQPENAEEYCRNILDNGGRIMGFGHRVYKAEDPRARHLRERSKALGEKMGQPKWFEILTYLEENVMSKYRDRGIFVNVDFFAGSIYYLLGIPDDLFISIFALGRIPGWTLQCLEQFDDNILIRPLLEYTGGMDLEYTPIESR
ncbi:MAG: citrate (Si)-synthase [SAR202 cluster bacterium]|jgi:citrate synthase|nr:citrate (Si)-synthase [SAR202 cluster bacterium]CAI8263588.1 MAG: Citrate synthase [Chloroflexota bacterium]MQG16736.1 citrate (Si)-synthase [SAR202 cluster bacterium]MQG36628.1 citrate (Si)-synthase [SAR202 cluster bacterium]MQG60547.1 citrate (Si)-synthase [SAR202 cluster bacterium]|tara:strand:+ start:4743 stop:5870 length:1128 start_codon:yes stop_codon:yes gene_type:complete